MYLRPEEPRPQLLERNPFVSIGLIFDDGGDREIRHLKSALLTRSTVQRGVSGKEWFRFLDRVIP